MLTVTENAKQELKKTLLAHTDDPTIGLRLSRKQPGQFDLELDSEAEGDQVVEYEGLKVLLIGPGVAEALGERTIDVQDTPNGTKLVISKG